MSGLKQDLREQFEKSIAELKTMRDDLRVRVHLAGMEAKEQLSKLEPKIDQAEHKLVELTDSAAESFREGMQELRNSLQSLRQRL